MDINQVAKSLGISLAQAKKLDALDGQEDGVVSTSIFEQAERMLNNSLNNPAYFEEISKGPGTPEDHNLINILKEFARVKFTGADTQGTISDSKSNESVDTMRKMANEAIAYFEKNGSLEGFTFEGFPLGISNLSFDTQIGYDDSSNDMFQIKDGQQVVDRKPDAFTLSLNFVLDGKEFTVSAESTNVGIFTDKSRQDFIAGMEHIRENISNTKKETGGI